MASNDASGGSQPGWVPPPGPVAPRSEGSGPWAGGPYAAPGPGGNPTGPWPPQQQWPQPPWGPEPKPKKRFGCGGLIGAFFLGVVATVVGGIVLLVVIGLVFADDLESGFYDSVEHGFVGPEAEVPVVGDCLVPGPDRATVTSTDDVVDCDRLHGSEVTAVLDAPGRSGRPAEADLEAFGDDACLLAFEQYVGSDYDDSDLDYQVVVPDRAAWDRGDRSVWCLVDTTGGFGQDGTVRNSHR